MKFKQACLFILFLVVSSVAIAADKYKVVLHLSNQHKLHTLVNNVTNIRKAYGDDVELVTVVNGPAVTKFAKLANTDKQIKKLIELDAGVSVCSNAMRNKHMLKEQLMDGLIYLEEGGVARIIKLQAEGYSYIKI